MFRRKIGYIAIGLLTVGGLLLMVDADSRNVEGLRSACLHIGVFMALVWLAEPQLRSLPLWLPIAIVGLPLLLFTRPRMLPLGLAGVALLWIMRPKRREGDVHGSEPAHR